MRIPPNIIPSGKTNFREWTFRGEHSAKTSRPRACSKTHVCIGDRFAIGTAEVVVTQPRLPCFKLNLKFGRDDMIKRFLASHLSGFYLRVLREGEVGAGDEIRFGPSGRESRFRRSTLLRLHLHESDSSELLERALQVEYLSPSWREEFSQNI